ncbi:MAG: serine/threonine protein kinase [Xanthomonadales bacterium]|nr:serine/threonine protein kinase [Xanthomonadales bacterium]
MPIRPEDLRTGGALQGAVARSLIDQQVSAALLHPGDEVGAFRILGELGRGGMAVVYLAERADGEYNQRVALKWIQSLDAGAEADTLFRRERQALADLSHPNIARLLDGGRTPEGRPWFAMEFIDGAPIDQHAVDKALPLRTRIELLLQVCEALAFAHGRGILHRDVKPSNVMVDSDGRAKLLDFGIAQVSGQEDALGRFACTPGFASPEQMRGEAASVRSDVFQMGRLIAATLSHDAEERDTVVAAGASRSTVLTQHPDMRIGATAVSGGISVEERAAGETACRVVLPGPLPDDLRAIIERALAAEAQHRYGSMHALADDLRAWLEHRPVSARRRTASYLTARWVQRHPFASVATSLVLLLLAGMAWSFSSQIRAERDLAQVERDTARHERDAAELARRRSQAVVQFLNEDVLDAANPLRRAPGAPEVTVRAALDAAEKTAGERLADQPDVLLSVLSTLATLRFEFGEYDESAALYERAVKLADVLPADDPQRQSVLANYGALLISLQDFPPAIAIYEALLAQQPPTRNDNRLPRFEWELRLLEARSRQGVDATFRPDFESLAVRADAALGTPNSIAGEAWLFVAHTYRNAGTPADGTDAARKAYDALAAYHGSDHPTTLKSLAILGHVLNAAGRRDEAIDAMRRAYETQRARYGPDGLDSTFLQNEYGFMLLSQGRYEEAVPILADLLERRAASGGEQSIGLIAPLSNLGNAYLRLGRFDEARAALDRAIRVLDAQPDPAPQMGAVLYRGRADVLRETGRFSEAERDLDAGDRLAAELADGDIRAWALKGSRARLRAARGDRAGGAVDLDAVIAALREQVPDTHPILQALIEARAGIGET